MALLFRSCPIHRSHFLNFASIATIPESVPNEVAVPEFRTGVLDPARHTAADIGKFYKIPSDVGHDKLFKFGGWPTKFMEQCHTFRESCVMIRKPALEVIHYLRNADYNRPVNKYVIYGKPGVGKTLTLSHLLHYAFVEGWLIVHVPWVPLWLSRPKTVSNSQTREGFVDLNNRASEWLLHFKTQNINLLENKQLSVKNDYQWNIRESTKAGQSLLSVVEYGISRGTHSSEVVIAVLQEIKELAKNGLVKAFVVIDGFNAIFHSKSKIKNAERQVFPPEKVSFIAAFRDMAASDWHNGAAVLVCDSIAVVGHEESILPLYQLTRRGFEFLFPFIPVEVPPYSEIEITNVLKYLRDRRWLGTDEGDSELKALSNYNGHDLMRICAPL